MSLNRVIYTDCQGNLKPAVSVNHSLSALLLNALNAWPRILKASSRFPCHVFNYHAFTTPLKPPLVLICVRCVCWPIWRQGASWVPLPRIQMSRTQRICMKLLKLAHTGLSLTIEATRPMLLRRYLIIWHQLSPLEMSPWKCRSEWTRLLSPTEPGPRLNCELYSDTNWKREMSFWKHM